MDEPRLKVKEVAAELGENVEVVRNWIKLFRDHLPTEKNDAGYTEFPPAALEKMREIQQMIRQRKYSTKQVAFHLAGGDPFGAAPTISAEEATEIRETLRQLATAQAEQRDLSRAILERLEARNELTTQLLIEMREAREAAKQLPEPKRSPRWMFWRKD